MLSSASMIMEDLTTLAPRGGSLGPRGARRRLDLAADLFLHVAPDLRLQFQVAGRELDVDLARARQVVPDRSLHAARAGRHDDDAIGEDQGLIDVVRHE